MFVLAIFDERFVDCHHAGNGSDGQGDPAVVNHLNVGRDWERKVFVIGPERHGRAGDGPTGYKHIECAAVSEQLSFVSVESDFIPHSTSQRLQIFIDNFSVRKHQSDLRISLKSGFD